MPEEEDTQLDKRDHLITQQALIAGALSQQSLVEPLCTQEVRLGGLRPSQAELEIGGLDGGPGRVAPDQGVGRIGLREDPVVEGQCGLGLGTMGLAEARAAGKPRVGEDGQYPCDRVAGIPVVGLGNAALAAGVGGRLGLPAEGRASLAWWASSPAIVPTKERVRRAAKAAWAGRRRAHLMARSRALVGRARMVSPRAKRPRSSARKAAEP